jgi:hypothetical protein
VLSAFDNSFSPKLVGVPCTEASSGIGQMLLSPSLPFHTFFLLSLVLHRNTSGTGWISLLCDFEEARTPNTYLSSPLRILGK